VTQLLQWAVHALLLLGLPPLLLGLIGRVKAFVAGRTGPPLLQPYWDLLRLLRKGAVYSRTTTWVFWVAPIVALASGVAAGSLLPLAAPRAPLAFDGDLVLFAYFLGLGRFLTMCGALDTGSSFEGMGASREAAISALAEPALFLSLVTLVVATHHLSLSTLFASLGTTSGTNPALWLAAAALVAVLLAENARIPVDDPATHLELTMIHEVMVLDHSGPDLALIEYGSAVKLFVTSVLLVGVVVPAALGHPLSVALAVLVVAAGIGAVESTMARLRLPRVKQFLIGATALGAVALAAELFALGAG
jgi:formate hydrogenlyase subunit 4